MIAEKTIRFPDGAVFKGELVLGQPQTNGEYKKNGVTYDGAWDGGLPNGQGTMLYPNGDYYMGKFKNGMRHGEGTYFRAKDNAYDKYSNWQNDKPPYGEDKFVNLFNKDNYTQHFSSPTQFLDISYKPFNYTRLLPYHVEKNYEISKKGKLMRFFQSAKSLTEGDNQFKELSNLKHYIKENLSNFLEVQYVFNKYEKEFISHQRKYTYTDASNKYCKSLFNQHFSELKKLHQQYVSGVQFIKDLHDNKEKIYTILGFSNLYYELTNVLERHYSMHVEGAPYIKTFGQYSPKGYQIFNNFDLFLKQRNKVLGYNIEDQIKQFFNYDATSAEISKHKAITTSDYTYIGEVKNGEPNGIGLMKHGNNESYYGYFANGDRHGKGRYCYANGNHYEGMWENGEKHGKGFYGDSKNKANYMGTWKNNKMHGQFVVEYYGGGKSEKSTVYFDNGNVSSSAPTSAKTSSSSSSSSTSGIPEYSVVNYSNGKYKGMVLNGKRHGRGTYYWDSGGRYEGDWVNGDYHGFGELYDSNDNCTYRGFYKSGKEHGNGKEYKWGKYVYNNVYDRDEDTYEIDERYEGEFFEGKRHGKGILFEFYRWSDGHCVDKKSTVYIGSFSNGSYIGGKKMSLEKYCEVDLNDIEIYK